MLFSNYINYFESLASSHKDIQHLTGKDPGLGKKRFATFNVDDVIAKQLRTTIGFPALLLEVYEWDFKGENVYDAKQLYTGAFSILVHAKENDNADEILASTTAERIMNDMIQKLWTDHYGPGYDSCETPFQYLNMNGNCVAIGPVFNNEFGWRFEFQFRPKLQQTLFSPPADGIFL